MLNEIKKYYKKAKRTALLAHDNLTNKWYHIFSIIELLPDEIPNYNIPTVEWYNKKIIHSYISSKNNNYRFYLIVNDLTTENAINIFNLPFTNNIIEEETNNYFNKNFRKEPDSEYPLILPSNLYVEDGIASVLPKRRSELYVWTQIDFNRDVENHFKSEIITREMKAMNQLTNNWLGFNIWSKSEHIGNIYLVAPNPYFRDIDISLSINPIGIIYHLKYRKGIKGTFIIRVIDKHGDAIALDKEFIVKENIGLLELPHEPYLIEIRVYDNKKNLIAIKPPATFIKSIKLSMSIKNADLHFKVNDRKEFVIEKFSKPQNLIVRDKRKNFNVEYYFKRAEEERKFITHRKTKNFIFFPGAKTEEEKTNLKTKSKKIIQEIINLSKETCYICDPYFNVNDLIDYAFYIKNCGVKLRILNCKEFLEKEKVKKLHKAIEEYNKNPFQKIELRLLKGNNCILHDRYIISDFDVWYLGTSLNQFGKRATTIAKVPKSSDIQIIKEVENWFFDDNFSVSIEDYISNLKGKDE
jgi:hypothetical protein